MNVNAFLPNVGGFVTSFIRRKALTPTFADLLDPIRFPHGPFQFKAILNSPSPYEIQASTDLKTWLMISRTVVAAKSFEYVDSDASKFGFRFYRVLTGGVISTTVLGYASVVIPPGFSMIANPFHSRDSTVSALFPGMPEGTTLCKFNNKLFRLTNNAMKMDRWINSNETLVPGEGAIIFNPTSEFRTINFVGEVMQGRLLNPIPAGFSIRSSVFPQPGRLNAELGFPLTEGDAVHVFDRDQQQYVVYNYPAKVWETNPPVIGVGESFWIGKTSAANWERDCVYC